MNWRRLRYAAGFAIALWLLVGVLFGIVKLIYYLFRGHPELATFAGLGILYTVLFGFMGWAFFDALDRNIFRRKGWRTTSRKKASDRDFHSGGWRRR